ncbi:MAG: hypothetical protein ACQEUK_04425 [Pseudomonadota bacterium]|uniref:hypothetical protein n=1 Tax=Halomonas alkaliantarctica TaxID=232346 RepID=UPI00265A8D4D|nr:hypothetical protein [Halomonas alkaliantarctica]
MQMPTTEQFVSVQCAAVGNTTMLALRLHHKVMRSFHSVIHCARERHSARRYLRCVATSADITATVG